MKRQSLPYDHALFVCMGSSCSDKGAKKVSKALKSALADRGLDKKTHLNRTRCLKCCGDGPNIVVAPDGHQYAKVKPGDAKRIVSELAGKKGKTAK
jgi:(2Fe-2S) ferredoxin